jgi:hypothetical protein
VIQARSRMSASVRDSLCPCECLNSDQICSSLRLPADPGREKPVDLILGELAPTDKPESRASPPKRDSLS